jgi:hypothetical protein
MLKSIEKFAKVIECDNASSLSKEINQLDDIDKRRSDCWKAIKR